MAQKRRSHTWWLLGLIAAACERPANLPDGAPATPTRSVNTASQPATAPTSIGLPTEQERVAAPSIPFQENAGQWSSDVKFKVDTFAGSLWVTDSGSLVHAFLGPVLVPADAAARETEVASGQQRLPVVARAASGSVRNGEGDMPGVSERGPGWALVENFHAGEAHVPVGLHATATNVSYFIGDDEAQWAPRVSTFEDVSLGQVWPGVEVVLHATTRNVEKVFHVAAGASPDSIALDLVGVSALRVGPSGTLVITTGNGDITQSAPVAYQTIDGVRRAVRVSYVAERHGYRFRVGDYDHTQELIIDPLLQSTYLGGTGNDYSGSPAINSSGEIVIAGYTEGNNFPGTTGGYMPSSNGGEDIVIARLNSTLTTRIQTTFYGGNGFDRTFGRVAFSSTGDVYVAGYGNSGNLPSATNTYGGSSSDIYIALLNGTLTGIVRSRYLGGTGEDSSYGGVALDASGNVYVAGWTSSTDYPGTIGTTNGAQTANAGVYDAVISRLNAGLTTLTRSSYLGGTGIDRAWGYPAVSTTGNFVYIAVQTASSSLPGLTGSYQPTSAGDDEGAIARFSLSLANVKTTYWGGPGKDWATGVAVNSSGQVLVTGRSDSLTMAGLTGGYQTTNRGNGDMAFSLISGDLTTMVQSTFLGGTGQDVGVHEMGVSFASNGDIFVAGDTISSDFPGTCGGIQPTKSGLFDLVVARLSGNLTSLVQSTYLGGTSWDWSYGGLAVDSGGNLILVGWVISTDMPGTTGGAQPTSGGAYDIFVSRVSGDLLGTVTCPIPCTTDAGCRGSTPYCNTATSLCVACRTDSNCSDGNPCTTDTCNTTTYTCSSGAPVANCCNVAGVSASCDDSNACTTDTCSLSSAFVTNGGMTGGSTVLPPTSWLASTNAQIGVGTAATNLGYSVPAGENISSPSPEGGTFLYIVPGTSPTPINEASQTLTGLVAGRRYRVTGYHRMSPAAATSGYSFAVAVRQGATSYRIGRVAP